MTSVRSALEARVSYAQDVGGRLRQMRQQRGLSLQDVERSSAGRLKAALVGSYERGDRNISATRLSQLAEFYGVTASDLLPAGGDDGPPSNGHGKSMVLDLQKLVGSGAVLQGVRSYVESIQHQRGDHNALMLSVRGDDVRAMAIMMGTTPDGLVQLMRARDVLVA